MATPAQLIPAPSFETAGAWQFWKSGGSQNPGRLHAPSYARTGEWLAYLLSWKEFSGGWPPTSQSYWSYMQVELYTGKPKQQHTVQFWVRGGSSNVGPLRLSLYEGSPPTERELLVVDPADYDLTDYIGFSVVFVPQHSTFTLRWTANLPAASTWYLDDCECYDAAMWWRPTPESQVPPREEVMAISTVEICNLALAQIGVGDMIASLEEQSESARLCRILFPHVRDAVLEDIDWRFASRRAALVSVGDADTVTEWSYRYQYPTDCLVLREILSGKRNPRADEKVPFLVESDETHGLVVLTDQADAIARYTAKVEDPNWWPRSFVDYLVYALALRLGQAKRIDRGVLQETVQLMEISRGKAAAVNSRQGNLGPLPDALHIAERNN